MRNSFSQKTDYNKEHIEYFVTQKKVDRDFAVLLSNRGVTPENFDKFFNFSPQNFYNPFLMKNMDKAAEMVNKVIVSKGSVLVYGDHDADGLSAACLLKLFFDNLGIFSNVVIPTREQGYGLNVEKIVQCMQERHYDLILTVDCGISNKAEVEAIKEKFDVEVLVTDHHEVPQEIPHCVCINPKLGYPFAYLSGSGVAFKLVQAVIGYEQSIQYADLASIGTIADMMPLLDENRDIVRLGLANFEHKGLCKLAEISSCTKPYNAFDIAMRIAPRINAVGRMGQLSIAVDLLCSQNYCTKEKAEKLNKVNDLRRKEVEQLMIEAQDKLVQVQAFEDNLIYLYDENWHKGILGIAANRFKDKYNLPTAILTREKDCYVGSARGNDCIDLHELFLSCSSLLAKFGGHRSSVGFSVHCENLTKLQDALSQKLSALPSDTFDPVYYYDLPFKFDYACSDYFSLFESMQPMFPNNKPTFYYSGFCTECNLFGQGKNHLRLKMDNGLELKGFSSFAQFYPALATCCECQVLFTLEYDNYSRNVIGIISQIGIKNSLHFDQLYAQNFIDKIDHTFNPTYLSHQQVTRLLGQDRTLAVFGSYIEFEHYSKIFDFSDYYLDMFAQNSIYTKSVLISPFDSSPFCNYKNIISFCNYKGVKINSGEGAVYYEKQMQIPSYISEKIDREICSLVFKALKRVCGTSNLLSLYFSMQLPEVSYAQFLLCIKVFSELDLIKFSLSDGGFILGVSKTKLTNSPTYNLFCK